MASPFPARHRTLLLVPLVAAAVAAIAGCGGGAKTGSVAGARTVAPTTDTTGSSPTSTPTAPNTTTAPTGTRSPSNTHTAPEPAFTEGQGTSGGAGAEGLDAALAVVRAHGFHAESTSTYRPEQTLRVLIGHRDGSSDSGGEQAFFFLGERYIGTDASSPSARVGVSSQSDTEVTLAYTLYRPGDPQCCPGAGQAKVRFQLNNGQLMALDPIPPVGSSSGASRR